MKKATLLIMLIIVCACVFVSCDTKDDVTYYQENVVGKYGDGISLIGTVIPETEPVLHRDVPRVEKSVFFDTRLEGWHFCSVYVVKGEKITLKVPEDKADGSVSAVVARYSASPYTVAINDTEITFESPVSGLLDVDLGDCYGDDFWQMNISGGVAASYLRLGLDRTSDWKNSIGYAVVDATNARIYLPAQYLDSSSDVEKAATWWRSFCEYVDRYVIGIFGVDKLTPTDVFVSSDYRELWYDKSKDILYVPEEYASVMLDADALSDGKLWDVMLAFTKGKTEYAGLEDNALSDVAQIIAAGAFVTLTDSILGDDACEEYWINNAYVCLDESLRGGLTEYGDLAVYVNLIHSFGEDKVVSKAVEYATPSDSTEEENGSGSEIADTEKPTLAQYFCDSFAKDGIDLAPYMNGAFGMDVVAGADGLTKYVPVQSRYAVGAVASEDKSGVVVNSGETTVFDFANTAVSQSDNVKLVKVTVGDKELKPNAEGLYEYKPSDDVKSQNFRLEYEVDGNSVTLSGRFTCNLAVSVFSRYENVPWRDMKTAVKEYEEEGSRYLTDTAAMYKAEIPKNDIVDDSVYTFSVNKGVIQVNETAVYTIYVKHKGMTRVDFGVPEYMFTMFENTLTVNEYTDLLSYEIELQKGVSYYYEIYILATKGNANACLGIQKQGETVIRDVDDDYLIYYAFDREDVAEYSAPALVPYSFGVNMEGRKPYEDLGTQLIQYPTGAQGSDPKAACDNNDDTSFTSREDTEHTYLFEFEESVRAEYLVLKTALTGVNYELAYSVDGEEYVVCDSGKVNKNIDVRFEKAVRIKYVRLTLTSDKPFASVVKDIYCGVYTKEATIVPSNSSRVLYQGKWQYKTGGISINGWILESYGDDAAIEFNFYGTGISVYCAKGDAYGSMQIYVDGKLNGAVNLNSKETQYDCNVFSVEFQEPGKHTIRIVPSSNDDIINLDYFTVLYAEQEEASPEVGNLWYFAIIPAVLIVMFAVCAALDIADRRKKKRSVAIKAGRTEGSSDERESEDSSISDEENKEENQ